MTHVTYTELRQNLPSWLALVQRGEHGDDCEAGTREVGNRHAGATRRAVPVAGEHQSAGGSDVVQVMAGGVAGGPVLAVAGNRAIDQARVQRLETGVVQAVGLEATNLEVLHQDVALQRERILQLVVAPRQRPQQRIVARAAQLEGDAHDVLFPPHAAGDDVGHA